MQVEHGLSCVTADVDDDPVVRQAGPLGGGRNELQHALGLVCGEGADVAEAVDVALGEHEEVDGRLRVDVADRDEAVGRVHMVAVANERAEEAVVRQRGSPPR